MNNGAGLILQRLKVAEVWSCICGIVNNVEGLKWQNNEGCRRMKIVNVWKVYKYKKGRRVKIEKNKDWINMKIVITWKLQKYEKLRWI